MKGLDRDFIKIGGLDDIFNIKEDVDLESIILEQYPKWDSFNIIQMMEMLEREYNITIAFDELRSFNTMRDVYDCVHDKIDAVKG